LLGNAKFQKYEQQRREKQRVPGEHIKQTQHTKKQPKSRLSQHSVR